MTELTFPFFIDGLLHRNPNARCFIEEDGTVTLRKDHFARVRRLVSGIQGQLSGQRSPKFAVLAQNSLDYATLWHAAFFGAGVIVPLNIRMTEDDLVYMINHSDAEILFADDNHWAQAEKIKSQCPNLRNIIRLGTPLDGFVSLADLDQSEEATIEVSENDATIIVFTGGTTGRPKGVTHTQRSLCTSILQQFQMYKIDGERSLFHFCAPLYHIAGVAGCLTAIAAGAASFVATSMDPDSFVQQVEDFEITHGFLVVTILGRVLNSDAFDTNRLKSLRQLSYGAAPITAALLERARDALPQAELLNAYGMTEANLVTQLSGIDHRLPGPQTKSVGRPIIGVDMTIRSDEFEQLEIGQTGEICVRQASLMKGYYNDPEKTAEAIKDGWYRTGDIGYFDENGYLYLVDRKKDMIVTGGENVYSQEVENAIAAHPAVEQVAVIGVPHEDWGEAIHAVVVPRAGMSLTEQDVIDHARSKIAKYKCPKTVDVRSEPLPMSGVNKVLKTVLRDEYKASATAS